MSVIPRRGTVVPFLLGLFLGAGGAEGRTWVVQVDGAGDAPTIQAAIDAADAGDTIRVLAGRYFENIDFAGKDLVVQGSGWDQTILDGGRSESCVTFANGETRAAILEGFQVTGGESSGGGGVFILNAEPTIRDNQIVGNTARVAQRDGFGGGVFAKSFEGHSPLIEDNHIVGNESGLMGGGVWVSSACNAVVRGNRIELNRCWRGDGGGVSQLSFGWPAHVVIEDNLVRRNRAGDHGGGIYAGGGLRSTFEITRNVVFWNQSAALGSTGESGGGIWVGGESGTVRQNTIVHNLGSFGLGGGVAVAYGTPIIEENIIALSWVGGGIRCVRDGDPVIRNNLFWGNLGGEEDQGCGVDWEQAGNVLADPLFCDPSREVYTLAENSPALLHPAGPLGALPTPGCQAVLVTVTTWGRLKSRFGPPALR